MNETKHHELKTFLDNYRSICSGKKKFDVRRNDRGFRIGDTITFIEGWMQSGDFIETGRKVEAVITYIDTFGLMDPNHDVILSILIIDPNCNRF